MADELCRYCSALFPIQTGQARRPVKHHSNIRALFESAITCGLCNIIKKYWSLDARHHDYADTGGESSDLPPLSFQIEDPGSFASGASWMILSGNVRSVTGPFSVTFHVSVTTCAPDSDAGQSPLWITGVSSLEEKCAVIKSWYTECEANHPECKPPHHEYPARLVEVGTNGADPRLVSTNELPMKNARYAALSYCWGNTLPLTTTKETLASFSKGIPSNALPRTFLEAILVTKKLDIRYIWIDSLCIVQDDPEDWRREAARMEHTYSGSAITISALDAVDSTKGCFIDSVPNVTHQDGLLVTQLSISPTRTRPRISIRAHEGDIRRRLDKTVLSTRGWTLQEHLLSHREVECMQPEIHWRCQRSCNTESRLSFSGKDYHPFQTRFLPQYANPAESHGLWRGWMSDYSTRAFTFERDRLCALAGIVQHYGRRTGHKHVLASWQETMVTDLMWLRLGEPLDTSMALPGIPSWSWLSRARQVDFDFWAPASNDGDVTEDCTTVVEAEVEWEGEPLMSNVKGTTLVLEGPVQQMRLRVDPRMAHCNPPYMTLSDEKIEWDNDAIPWRCAGQFDCEVIRKDDSFTCLLLRSRRVANTKEGWSLTETFMMLIQEQDGTYRRVGLGTLRGKETGFLSAARKKVRLI